MGKLGAKLSTFFSTRCLHWATPHPQSRPPKTTKFAGKKVRGNTLNLRGNTLNLVLKNSGWEELIRRKICTQKLTLSLWKIVVFFKKNTPFRLLVFLSFFDDVDSNVFVNHRLPGSQVPSEIFSAEKLWIPPGDSKPWPWPFFHPRIVGRGHQQPLKRVTFSPSQKRSRLEWPGRLGHLWICDSSMRRENSDSKHTLLEMVVKDSDLPWYNPLKLPNKHLIGKRW